ncbi:MAG TPA: hypothetical protein VK589_03185 [Chryseolinea sp.]|nr:hypothetical protein [Chryseolinea sp.]
MNNNEEDLQRNIESGVANNADDLDVKAYEEVFARLRKKPNERLSVGFADIVIVRIQQRQQHNASRDFIWLALGVFLLTISLIVATVLSGFKPSFAFLKGMSAYAGVLAFGIVFILLLNRLEKKLLTKSD